MYLPIASQPSCARAWLAASQAILAGREAYNVVIDVTDPVTIDKNGDAVITLVDSFLRLKGQQPIATIANTIFPHELYRRFGAPEFYRKYWAFCDSLSTNPHSANSRRWGRYFDRMTRHPARSGYNPLHELIEKLRAQQQSGRQSKATHELAIYDPLIDRTYVRGGQSISSKRPRQIGTPRRMRKAS